jgi:hypothetical protein
MRGGSWVGPGAGMRSAQRLHNLPTITFGNLGFRVVLARVSLEDRQTEFSASNPGNSKLL